MPCPLRFVLAGVSAAVLATLFFMGRSDPAVEKQKAASEDGAGSRARQWLRLLLDFFTGKYLYDTWRKSGSSSHASSGAASKASGCPFARLHGSSTGAADAQAAAAAARCPAHKHAAAAAAATAGSDRQGLHEE